MLSSSFSRVQLQQCLPVFLENFRTQLLYRPGTGRLTARYENDVDFEHVRSSVGDSLASVDVAFADREFEFKVERLGGGDSEIFKVKQRIKGKFDPLNKMNPFAKM
jgi:hypothetical protein